MKILYVSQYFPPEMGAPAARVAELSRYWALEGHDVTVLTGFPNHPTGIISPEYRKKFRHLVMRENVQGVKIVRTWLLPSPNRKSYERMLNYGSFCMSAAADRPFSSQARRHYRHFSSVACRIVRMVVVPRQARALYFRSPRSMAGIFGRGGNGKP